MATIWVVSGIVASILASIDDMRKSKDPKNWIDVGDLFFYAILGSFAGLAFAVYYGWHKSQGLLGRICAIRVFTFRK